ncbi:MAG TPA: TerB family tellurite resistance protein [Polyangiaceae bacterium LLY-WYZ-15_(1-7)]|nr:TerB family tellurite resistance protein [Polyangiaceae bacterium LLY-WYZ-15_(1-7)]HJL06004.1 TerB family tellurite resistance protein [Polyangiaceae bacterium LLY-WYZ-15_(1-7)]HJL10185.1 TerB family tellurite resistance protein [Polyangiaceae bacterium LLY-WYZ-15_(1-7)]HJL25223.1 TerB family tellurite resistance protein [Polyangiaceae bacterium LLY-WYZ-15_(1-7)]HJL28350.1 TerB family tellurite resistance protein [Polyangiaceae bacterium LLY-WYZ-15_(1-7)]
MAEEDTGKHPASELPREEKLAYLCVVASIAGSDGEVTDDEVANLRALAKSMELPKRDIGQVIGAAEDPEHSEVQAALSQLAGSELRFTLITDLLFLAFADDHYSKEEQREVAGVADRLGVSEKQVAAIRSYVEAVGKAGASDSASAKDLKKLGGDVAAGLASAGVPVAAVAVSGSVFGLSAAGITSGLAALGMGLGMTTGIGVAAAIGVGSYFGVRWLYKKVAED